MSSPFNGVPTVTARDGQGAEAVLCLHGGQLLQFTTAAGAHLFVSDTTLQLLKPGGAIRGGAPVCLPQFSNLAPPQAQSQPPLPSHGFARQLVWHPLPQLHQNTAAVSLTAASAREQVAALGLSSKIVIPPEHNFVFTVTVTVSGGNTCSLSLSVQNLSADKPHAFTGALHTYFAVSSLANTTFSGRFQRCPEYLDTAKGRAKTPAEEGGLKRIAPPGAEVDRIYVGANADNAAQEPIVVLHDLKRTIGIHHSASMRDLVIWSPGEKKVFGDLPALHFDRFVCVEAVQIEPAVVLAPGEEWCGGQRIVVA